MAITICYPHRYCPSFFQFQVSFLLPCHPSWVPSSSLHLSCQDTMDNLLEISQDRDRSHCELRPEQLVSISSETRAAVSSSHSTSNFVSTSKYCNLHSACPFCMQRNKEKLALLKTTWFWLFFFARACDFIEPWLSPCNSWRKWQ